MSRFSWSALALFFLFTFATTSDLFAQLRGSLAQPEPNRGRVGILGSIREARDERFNRANPPPTPPAKPNVNSQANKPNTAQNQNVSGNRIAAQQPSTNQQHSAAQQPSRNNGQQPSLRNPSRPIPFSSTNPGYNSPSASRNQIYPPAMAQQNPTRALRSDSVNPSNPISSLNASPVVAASALVPNRLPYTGSGIVIRLPADLNAEVNYLVDDVEPILIHSGEEHRLRLKGKYVIRFSRGVTEDQRSLGEAHYSLNEGVYEFVLTEKGWDLLRELEGGAIKSAPTSQDAGQWTPAPKTASRLELQPQGNINGSRNLPLSTAQPIAPNPFDATNMLEPRPVEIEKRQPALVPNEPVTEETLPSPTPESSR